MLASTPLLCLCPALRDIFFPLPSSSLTQDVCVGIGRVGIGRVGGGGAYEVSRHDLVDGALVGDEGVVEHAGEADHGEAAVLDLSVLYRQVWSKSQENSTPRLYHTGAQKRGQQHHGGHEPEDPGQRAARRDRKGFGK